MLRFCPLSLKIMEKFVEVREAVREDCQEIRALIQELADFEEMPDGPKLGYKDFERDGFDVKNPLYKCYVALSGGKIVGYAWYFYIYSCLDRRAVYLEDLYVKLEFREKHIGSRLFEAVAKQTFSENCPYLQFSVLGWNPSQEFYKAKGSIDLTETDGWHIYRLDHAAIKQLASNFTNGVCCEVRQVKSIDEEEVIKKLAREAFVKKKIKNDDEVTISIEEKEIAKDDDANYGYLVGTIDEKIIGYALYCYVYPTWVGKSLYLRELYALPGDNSLNVKQDLFSAVVKKAYDENCSRVDFWILDFKNEGKFYTSNGAVDLTDLEDWHMYRLFELPKKSITTTT